MRFEASSEWLSMVGMKSVAFAFLVSLAVAGNAAAQPPQPPAQQAPLEKPVFVPEVGQAGKDVVWVPTPQLVVEKMLDVAKVTKDDYVIDLGSGDGRNVIAAAKRGAR